MKKRTAVLAEENELLVDLTFHNVAASLLTEFTEKIAQPYYSGNLNAAVQDLILKALAEQDLSSLTLLTSKKWEPDFLGKLSRHTRLIWASADRREPLVERYA